jgi:L-threonylcarbamoyladenylate synthase
MTIQEAAGRIRAGELVAFPTETVYGLGANALDARAVARIYEMKGRPAASPLIVHVASLDMAKSLVTEWPPQAGQLARLYWPGPLTLVLPKVPAIPDIVTAGLPTVGIRVPNHPVALALIREAGVPIAAPSANRFMGLSPTTAEHVREAFGNAVPVVDGGPCQVGIESTVISIVGGEIRLLRPGMISIEDVERAETPLTGTAHPAPGMHLRHYSPRTPLVLSAQPDPLGAYVWINLPANAARSIHMPAAADAYAARLYSVLHELDGEGWPVICVEPPPDTIEWAAVRDRLNRASSK